MEFHMKILVVGQVFYPDHFRINDLVKELAKNHQVKMVTGLPDYDQGKIPKEYRMFRKRREKYHGADVIRVPIISRRTGPIFRSLNYLSFAFTGSIYTFFLREKFDVVFSYQTSPITMFVPGMVYAKKNKVKSVLYTLDLWPESVKAMSIKENSSMFRILHKLSRKIYLAADKVLVSSPAFKDYLETTIGLEGDKIYYLPQYTDEVGADDSALTVKKEKGRTLQFTFAGNIGLVQDLETVVKAASLIKDRNFTINIVGSGSHEDSIKQMVEDLGVNNHFIFHGRKNQEQMDTFYAESDVCILTLKNDDFIGKTIPGKLQTYMAKGKAILGAISNDTLKIIEESKSGLCVESGDYLGLSENMLKFIDNPELVESFGLNAKEYYHNNFRKEIFMETLMDLLKGENKNV